MTIIASRHDSLVTPVETALINEDDVRNIFIQDYSPLTSVGHAVDANPNVGNLVLNAVEKTKPEKSLESIHTKEDKEKTFQ